MTTTPQRPIVLAITGASGAAYAVRLLQQLLLANQSIHLIISPSGAAVISQELGIEVGQTRERIQTLLRYAWPSTIAGSPIAGSQPTDSHIATSNSESTSSNHAGGNPASGNPASANPAGGRVWKPLTSEEVERVVPNLHVYDYRNFFTPVASGSFRTAAMIICPCSGATLSGVVHAAGNNLIQRAADVHLKEHRKLILVPRETPLSVFQLENMTRAAQAGAILMPAMPGWYHGVQTPVDLIDFVVSRILDHLDIEHSLMKRWGADHPGLNPEHLRSGEA
jgi:4-hydroxy-3-polyprenylbenzoate decarboxylase